MMLASLGYNGSGGPSALVVAAHWLEGLFLGSIATAVAVVAVAVVGLMMLNGRIDVRRGVTVMFGCFLLFGAPVIGAGLRGMAGDASQETPYAEPPIATVRPPVTPPPKPTPVPYDPYAGASLQAGN